MVCDAYILKVLESGKVRVEPETGRVYSYVKGDYYKKLLNNAGYEFLDWKFLGKRKSVLVHRIIYLAAKGRIGRGKVIDHIDRDRANNRIDNLRAVSQRQNLKNRGKEQKT